MNAPHPHIETDWKAVAMFLAAFITEENPSYMLLIFQVIAECSKNTITAASSARKEMATP